MGAGQPGGPGWGRGVSRTPSEVVQSHRAGSTGPVLSTSGSSELTLGTLPVILKVTGVLKVRPDAILPPDLGIGTVGERAGPLPSCMEGYSHTQSAPRSGNWQSAGPLEEEPLIPVDVLWSQKG